MHQARLDPRRARFVPLSRSTREAIRAQRSRLLSSTPCIGPPSAALQSRRQLSVPQALRQLAQVRLRRADCRSGWCPAARDPATPPRWAGRPTRPGAGLCRGENDGDAHSGLVRAGLVRQPSTRSRAPCTGRACRGTRHHRRRWARAGSPPALCAPRRSAAAAGACRPCRRRRSSRSEREAGFVADMALEPSLGCVLFATAR